MEKESHNGSVCYRFSSYHFACHFGLVCLLNIYSSEEVILKVFIF